MISMDRIVAWLMDYEAHRLDFFFMFFLGGISALGMYLQPLSSSLHADYLFGGVFVLLVYAVINIIRKMRGLELVFAGVVLAIMYVLVHPLLAGVVAVMYYSLDILLALRRILIRRRQNLIYNSRN